MSYAYWFQVPLTCLACRTEVAPGETGLHVRGLNPDPRDEWVRPGDTLPVGLEDLGDVFVPTGNPPGAELRVLAGWACPGSNHLQWARMEFRQLPEGRMQFVSARSVPLTPDELRQADFVGPDLEDWLRTGPEDEVRELRDALPRRSDEAKS